MGGGNLGLLLDICAAVGGALGVFDIFVKVENMYVFHFMPGRQR